MGFYSVLTRQQRKKVSSNVGMRSLSFNKKSIQLWGLWIFKGIKIQNKTVRKLEN